MPKKTFIMLAAPSMTGKTYAANRLNAQYPSLLVVHNDDLMKELCSLTKFPVPDISKEEVWLPLINAKVDFYALTRHLHRSILLENDAFSVILAEGYMYMLQSYREQVQSGFNELGHPVDCYLLKYEPALEEQVIRQEKKFKELGWEETDNEHQRQLEVKWRKFEAPQDKELNFEIVDDTSLPVLLSKIMEASF